MSDKSFVTLEQHQCLVCGELYDTGTLLLDRRLKSTFDRHTVTGHGLCPKHKKSGFVCLIESDSKNEGQDRLNPEDSKPTGLVAYIREQVWSQVFNSPMPPDGIAYCQPGVISKLQQMAPDNGDPPPDSTTEGEGS